MLEARDHGFERLKAAQWGAGRAGAGAARGAGHPPRGRQRGVKGAGRRRLLHRRRGGAVGDGPSAAAGVQVAAGVPLMVGEGEDYRAFRIGLFGIDKLKDVNALGGAGWRQPSSGCCPWGVAA